MNVHFKCPNCGLEMLAETSSVGGTGQCPSCGQEFVVDAAPRVLPTVKALVVPPSPPPPPPDPHAGQGHVPSRAMPRPAPAGHAYPAGHTGQAGQAGHAGQAGQAGHAGQRRGVPAPAPRSQNSSETKDKILIASVLAGGGLLIFGLLYMMQHYNQNPPASPPATAVASPSRADHSVRDKDMERLEAKQKELEKELERSKLIREKQEQAEQEAIHMERRRQEAENARERTKVLQFYASKYFEGDEEAAAAFIAELENIRNDLALLPEDAKERSSEEAREKFFTTHLIERIGKNSTLFHWLEEHGRKAEDLLPGLAQKGPKSDDGTPGFDYSKYASSGSGFWVSADGWLLTNHHVVNSAKIVDLRLRDGTIIKAKVAKTDPVNDLALLKAETTPVMWLPVSKGESELKLGQTVFTIGYPSPSVQGLEPKFTDGRISSVTGIGDSKNHYQTTVPVRHGNSGGPLVDLLTGWVVGVVDSRLEDTRSGAEIANVSYAIKGNVVWTFLATVPEAKTAVERKVAAPLKKGDERAVIDRVKDSAILILQLR